MKIAVLVLALVLTVGVIGFNDVSAQANDTGFCPNGFCESGESASSCPQDCFSIGGGSGTPCGSNEQCPIAEYCESGKCRSRFEPKGILEKRFDTGDRCVQLAQCTGSGSNLSCNLAQPCTETFLFNPADMINVCTIAVKPLSVAVQDVGKMNVNGFEVYNSIDSQNPSLKAVPSEYLKRDGNDVISVYVEDRVASTAQGQVTTKIFSTFNVSDIIPNPGQVCENGIVVPKCAGTDMSCGFKPLKNGLCNICKKFSGEINGMHVEGMTGYWPVGEPYTTCNGNTIVEQVDESWRQFHCPGVYQDCLEDPLENPKTRTRVKSEKLCVHGCMVNVQGKAQCKPNNNPIITSVYTVPLAKRGETISINSTGYDPDMVYNETTGQSKREKIALGCSSVSSETGSEDEFEQIDFVPDLCEPITYRFSNPSCEYKIPDNAAGNIEFFCRTFDGELWSDEERSTAVYVDSIGPTIQILSPPEGSVQQRAFAVNIRDTDETGLASCEYRIIDNGVETKPWTDRTCSSAVTVTIGPGRDCPTQGSSTCKIEAKATDLANNTATASRSLSVRYLYSNITSPPAGSYQRRNFTVTIIDTNLAGGGFSKCEYRVRQSSGITLDWTNRSCNSNVKITVGNESSCSAQGENVCIVEARAFSNAIETTLNGSTVVSYITGEVGLRMFSIDYTSPFSEILSPESGPWISTNFTVTIKDNDPSNLGISKCQYRVLSKGQETVPWTDRTCSSATASTVQIKLGTDCRDEGGYVCTVQARAYSVSGNEGALDQRNFSIILSDVVLDGFNLPLGVDQTDIGINFSGVPKQTINLPTFRVCSSSATVAQCKNAYSASTQNCGSEVDASGVVRPRPCLCGSLNSYKCEFRCNDMQVGFYYLASGFTAASSNDFVTNVFTADCPTFNIELLNEWLARFRYAEQNIFIMKQQTMVLITETCGEDTESETCTELYYILGKLTDALNLATSHIAFMEETMQDLSVSKSNMLIEESERVMALILEILQSIDFLPSALDMSMEIPNTVRLNETVSIPVRVSKQGTLDVYGKVSCTATPPSGSIISKQFGCRLYENSAVNRTVNRTFDFEFNATKAGLWSVSCNLVGSFRSDCSLSFPLKLISGSFNAIPPIDSYIQNVTLSASSVENRSSMNIVIDVRNPDIDDRFGFVGCRLTQPCSANTTCSQVQSSLSTCERLGADENKTLTITQQFNKVGTWTVASCFVNVSTRSDCVSSRLHNNTNVNKNIAVTPPAISILSVLPPESQIPFNSNASTLITVQNSANTNLSVFGTCMYRTPLLVPKTIRSRTTIPAGGEGVINVSTKGNETGMWLVIRCAIGLVGGVEDEKDSTPVNSNFTVFIRTVCGNNACEINETVANCPADCTAPPAAVCGNTLCEQGESFQACSSDCPPPNTCASNSDTPGTSSRCLCQNSVIVSCPVGYSCADHKCVSNEPEPECVADIDCSTGEVCRNDRCVRSAQCTTDSQCPAGKICSSGVCVPGQEQPSGGGIDAGVILFIIIIIMIILIPIVIFTYLHRAVDYA